MKKKLMLICVLIIMISAPVFAISKYSVGVKVKKLGEVNTFRELFIYISGQTGDTPNQIFNTLFDLNKYTYFGITGGYEVGKLQADLSITTRPNDFSFLINSATIGLQIPISFIDLGVSIGTLFSLDNSVHLFILRSNLDINLDPIVIKTELSSLSEYNNILSNPYTDYDNVEWGISLLYRF